MPMPSSTQTGPLSGYRFIELAAIGPVPLAGQLLADMGAEIILINRPGPMAKMPDITHRGKKTITLDLQKPEAVSVVLDLLKTAHGLFEGLRPGVTERLGLGPKDCHAVNPKLVYGRMTGWGQTGPWAKMAGHDINYLSITGALGAMGTPDRPPSPPLNLVADYGGGTMFLIMGLLAALLRAEKTGKGDIIDAGMIDGVSSLMGLLRTLDGMGRWSPKRANNMLDGGYPYYRCYTTSDGKFMAVGCLEPQFFALMLERLGLNTEDYGKQNDARKFSEQHALLEQVFSQKTRDEWAKIFDGSDACVTPVLDYTEAGDHPQNLARGGLSEQDGFMHPHPAPDFAAHKTPTEFNIAGANDDGEALLADLGYSAETIDNLRQIGAMVD